MRKKLLNLERLKEDLESEVDQKSKEIEMMKFHQARADQEHRELLILNETLVNDIKLINEKLKYLDFEEVKVEIEMESELLTETGFNDNTDDKSGENDTHEVSDAKSEHQENLRKLLKLYNSLNRENYKCESCDYISETDKALKVHIRECHQKYSVQKDSQSSFKHKDQYVFP